MSWAALGSKSRGTSRGTGMWVVWAVFLTYPYSPWHTHPLGVSVQGILTSARIPCLNDAMALNSVLLILLTMTILQ